MRKRMHQSPQDAELWERQDGESPQAWESFVAYRDLGAERSLTKAGELVGRARQTMSVFSMKWKWVERCAAWDAELDRQARQAQLDAIKKMRKRHADLAMAALAKTARALARIPEEEWKAGDVARMMEVASKLERIARGDVSEVIEEREGEAVASQVVFYMPSNSRGDEEY